MERKFNKQQKFKIKKGDQVQVIAGDDKGKKGRVLEINPDNRRVLIEGINIVKKHLKAKVDPKNPNGGIISKEAPVHISNVMLVDNDGVPTRVGRRRNAEGKLERYSKKSETKAAIK